MTISAAWGMCVPYAAALTATTAAPAATLSKIRPRGGSRGAVFVGRFRLTRRHRRGRPFLVLLCRSPIALPRLLQNFQHHFVLFCLARFFEHVTLSVGRQPQLRRRLLC